MRPKSLILLALALGCGLAASIGISRVMDANANRSVDVETTPIYVALHNINLGDPIGADMVTLEEWPRDKAPQGCLTSLEDLEGRRPRATIFAGTPILEAQLLAQGETADPVANIPDGFRLSTISVNAEKSAAGLLSPGDRVDVQLFMAANARAGVAVATTRVILQNIRVFAIEQAVQRSAESDEGKVIPKTVSLLVTPEQASRIDLAQNLGELSLIPRNPNDETASQMVEVTLQDLMGTRSESNDRKTEQNRDRTADSRPGMIDSMIGLLAKTAKERPPFEMTIVRAEEVDTMQFDRRTGKPLDETYENYQPTKAASMSSGARRTEDGRLDFTPPTDDSSFPIDFEEE